MALSFPDDRKFDRRSAEREAQMNPHDAEQPSDVTEAPRVRPAVPPGAQAAATAITELPMPTPILMPSFSDASSVAQAAPSDAPLNGTSSRIPERRRAPRQTLVAKAVVRSDFDQAAVATGFLSNISTLGVGFHTRRPLAVGENFQMHLDVGPMKWATRLRVVCCHPHDSGTFDVGAEFIASEPVDQLELDLAA